MKWYYHIPFVSLVMAAVWEKRNLKAIRQSLKRY